MPKLPADYFDTSLEGMLFFPMCIIVAICIVVSAPFYLLGKSINKLLNSLEKRRRE